MTSLRACLVATMLFGLAVVSSCGSAPPPATEGPELPADGTPGADDDVEESDESPPSPRAEDLYYERRPGRVWLEGYWDWTRDGWVWRPGRYMAARPDQIYIQGRWERRGARWRYVEGRWVSGRPGSVWRRGYWTMQGNVWVWIPGEWISRRPSHTWEPGRWERRNDRIVWIPGRWRRTVE